MSELVHAELNKRAVSNLIATIFLILIVITMIIIFWGFIKEVVQKSPAENIDCLSVINEIGIKKACYLNENEIEVRLKRGFDNYDIEKLKFSFSGEDSAVWELTGKKCSDVRTGDKYGDYCEILNPGEEISYVFYAVDTARLNKIRLAVGNGNLCSVSEKTVENNC